MVLSTTSGVLSEGMRASAATVATMNGNDSDVICVWAGHGIVNGAVGLAQGNGGSQLTSRAARWPMMSSTIQAPVATQGAASQARQLRLLIRDFTQVKQHTIHRRGSHATAETRAQTFQLVCSKSLLRFPQTLNQKRW